MSGARQGYPWEAQQRWTEWIQQFKSQCSQEHGREVVQVWAGLAQCPSTPAEDPAAEMLGLATCWFPSHWENGISYHFLSCPFVHYDSGISKWCQMLLALDVLQQPSLYRSGSCTLTAEHPLLRCCWTLDHMEI